MFDAKRFFSRLNEYKRLNSGQMATGVVICAQTMRDIQELEDRSLYRDIANGLNIEVSERVAPGQFEFTGLRPCAILPFAIA